MQRQGAGKGGVDHGAPDQVAPAMWLCCVQQVSQELKRRQEAQMLQDSEAMPPPPAPPPLPGQLPTSGDPFAQPPGPHDPPEGGWSLFTHPEVHRDPFMQLPSPHDPEGG